MDITNFPKPAFDYEVKIEDSAVIALNGTEPFTWGEQENGQCDRSALNLWSWYAGQNGKSQAFRRSLAVIIESSY